MYNEEGKTFGLLGLAIGLITGIVITGCIYNTIINEKAIRMGNGQYNEQTGVFEWIDHSFEKKNQ